MVPVVQALVSSGAGCVEVTGRDWALDGFTRAGVEARELTGETDLSHRLAGADVLLTATSWPPDDELMLWQAAERAGVPSLAVFDFWSHYRARCCDDAGRPVWPTRIAAMDSLAAEEMIADGVPPERIVVTGQPFLEVRAKALKELAVCVTPADRKRILYVSQPLSVYPGAGRLPYDEFSVARLVAAGVGALQRSAGCEITLVVRPHPKEGVVELRGVLDAAEPKIPFHIAGSEDPGEAVLKSHVVVGISSMLLIEAALGARPVISVQPGLPEPDAFPLSRLGYCPRVGTLGTLVQALENNLKLGDPVACEEFLRAHVGATGRVVENLLELAGR